MDGFLLQKIKLNNLVDFRDNLNGNISWKMTDREKLEEIVADFFKLAYNIKCKECKDSKDIQQEHFDYKDH